MIEELTRIHRSRKISSHCPASACTMQCVTRKQYDTKQMKWG